MEADGVDKKKIFGFYKCKWQRLLVSFWMKRGSFMVTNPYIGVCGPLRAVGEFCAFAWGGGVQMGG